MHCYIRFDACARDFGQQQDYKIDMNTFSVNPNRPHPKRMAQSGCPLTSRTWPKRAGHVLAANDEGCCVEPPAQPLSGPTKNQPRGASPT
jgi:hypothetical protein